jgi:hypothetical protein
MTQIMAFCVWERERERETDREGIADKEREGTERVWNEN